jgi:hypothetical protein
VVTFFTINDFDAYAVLFERDYVRFRSDAYDVSFSIYELFFYNITLHLARTNLSIAYSEFPSPLRMNLYFAEGR